LNALNRKNEEKFVGLLKIIHGPNLLRQVAFLSKMSRKRGVTQGLEFELNF
jgi:hypothetical protein